MQPRQPQSIKRKDTDPSPDPIRAASRKKAIFVIVLMIALFAFIVTVARFPEAFGRAHGKIAMLLTACGLITHFLLPSKKAPPDR